MFGSIRLSVAILSIGSVAIAATLLWYSVSDFSIEVSTSDINPDAGKTIETTMQSTDIIGSTRQDDNTQLNSSGNEDERLTNEPDFPQLKIADQEKMAQRSFKKFSAEMRDKTGKDILGDSFSTIDAIPGTITEE